MLVLLFKNGDDDTTRYSLDLYYMPLVRIEDFNALIDNRPFFDQPVKNKQEAYEKLIETSRNDDYTAWNLLDYLFHQNYCIPIRTDLSKQKNTIIPQQINFIGKLEEDDGAAMFFITEKQPKSILNFSIDSLIVTE